MKNNFLVFFIVLTILFSANKNSFSNEIWNSSEGLKKLEKSQFKNDFYQLINFYQPQINPTYCSIASAVIILNALNYGKIESQEISEIRKPNGDSIPFKLYTQQNFFNEKTERIKPRSIIEYQQPKSIKIIDGIEKKTYDPGLTLEELAKILSKAYNLKTKIYFQDKSDSQSIEKFRQSLKKILSDNKSFVIANFDGSTIGHKTKGHISPIVAYEEESDSVLVLDVALHQNQWFWVNINDLVNSMHTKDGESYRGYIVVSK